jgi:putative heme-binding domain-containing protein
MSFFRCLITACTLSASLHAAEDKMRLVRETEALTPDQERSGLHVPPGFTVQLFASEPMINKPINMAFDARGRLWVSSTVEYPYAADKSRWSDEKGTRVKDSHDAIKILADTDGDGKADKVTDFADGLNIPTGVLPWHKPEHKAGCIAWSIPNIWYFADTDGDDKADHREILFGPLGYEKDTHGMCSSFRLGLDGWVYATHGFNNTSHLKAKDGSTLDLHSGNVFRFRPDGSRVEKWTSGQVNPFGLCWDRFGNLYSADCHSSPIYQLIRGACYPSFGKPDDGLGFAPVMCEHSHGSTGICGIVYLDGGVWGPEWDNHTLVGNCVTSRVNHDKVTFTGSTPKANEQPDFITSDDPWFRPVDLQLGPDNALYIADFYNKIIGHYEVPLDHPGRDKERGRIWRVVKEGTASPPRVSAKPLDALGDRNVTRRYLAFGQLALGTENVSLNPDSPLAKLDAIWVLLARGQKDEAITRLKKVSSAHDGSSKDELVMTGLLRVVEALDKWPFGSDEEFAKCFAFCLEGLTGPAARRQAFATLAMHPQRSSYVSKQMISPLDPNWAFPFGSNDAAMSLTHKLAVRSMLEKIGYSTLEQTSGSSEAARFVRDISLAIRTEQASDFLFQCITSDHVVANGKPFPINPAALTQIARYGNEDTIRLVTAYVRNPSINTSTAPISLVSALSDGISERGVPPPPEFLSWAQELAAQLLAAADKQPAPSWIALGDAKWSLQTRKCADGTEAQVLQSMIKGGGDEEKRTGVMKSKSFAAPTKLVFWVNGHRGPPTAEAHEKNLVRVVDAQSGAVLGSVFPPRSDVCQKLEMDLAQHVGKAVRLEIVDGDEGKSFAWLGITRIEPAVVSVNDFQNEDTTRESLKTLATMLQHSAPAALREKLAAYLPPRPAPPPLPVSAEQRKQLDTLIAARVAAFAKAKPDLETGANVFKMNCAACHQIKGEGGLIGPQLDGIGARGPARLCEDILDPNRNVDAHFHLHTLTLKDSSTFAGFLKAELGQVNVLADATGKEHRIGKKDIAKTEVTPISLMPPTFGQTIEEATFMDLLGYLLNEKAGK